MVLPKALVHALCALCQLSQQPSGGVVCAAAIARELEVPTEYIRKILYVLSKAGYTATVRGRLGGYALKVALKDITVADVWNCLGIETESRAKPDRSCRFDNSITCRVEGALSQLQQEILTTYAGRSVASLTERMGSAPCSQSGGAATVTHQSPHRQPFSVPSASQWTTGETSLYSGT